MPRDESPFFAQPLLPIRLYVNYTLREKRGGSVKKLE